MTSTTGRQPALAHQRFMADAEAYRGLTLAETFTRIHATNLWGAEASRSGLGSEHDATRVLRAALADILRALGAGSILDVPCGDFGWLSHVDLGAVRYTGADIVAALVAENTARYGAPGRTFVQLDLTRDDLPRADVVLCRDCLVHLSFANVHAALANIRRSGAAYLLATTFTAHERNEDIMDGDWRVLNLERAPFGLPPPEAVLVEECTEAGGTYADKSLGLWRVPSLPIATP